MSPAVGVLASGGKQTQSKTIVVLANSYKHHGRCIAGREVVETDSGLQVGGWIRPVSEHDGGAFTIEECRLDDRAEPELMDVICVPVLHRERDPAQPDNWVVPPGNPWRRVGDATCRLRLGNLLEFPSDLWLQPRRLPDRVSPEFLRCRPTPQSLYLIRPQFFQVEIEPRIGMPPRPRAVFSYNGVTYRLGLTDPCIIHQYCARHRDAAERRILNLPCGSNVALCVSLAKPFHGYHYKVVATVFEGVT